MASIKIWRPIAGQEVEGGFFWTETGRRNQRQEVDRWTTVEQKGRPGHVAGHKPVIIEYLEDCPAKAYALKH